MQELALKTGYRARLLPAAERPFLPTPEFEPGRRACEQVADACLADALDAFGLGGAAHGFARRMAARLLATPVQRLARRLLVFDAIVDTQGLQAGGAYALSWLARGTCVQGEDRLPASGPLLLVANHPGLADAAALFAQLPRADLRVLAAPRRLLAALPGTRQRLITVPAQRRGRMAAARQATHHLRGGGSVLTFPGGRIEPDPAVRPGAVAALERWSACVDLFARRVPALTIVPVAVQGVLSPAALAHPLTRLRRDPRDRDWLAATLQMLDDEPAEIAPEVIFGAPIRPAELAPDESTRAAVRTAMTAMLERGGHATGPGRRA